jgi:hypothetical protein
LECSIKDRDGKWFSLDRGISKLDVTVFFKMSPEEKKELLLAEIERLEMGEQVNEATN